MWLEELAFVIFASPKSRILACPLLVTKMLAGLMSRCTIPWPCAASSASAISIARATVGQLMVHVKGREEPYPEAKVARCFPWSLPETYISIRDKDGKEIALLNSADELDPASRKVVLRELQEKVFAPKILRVDCKEEFGVTSFTAETDRGMVTFQIRSRDDVRVLSGTRALFRDADGADLPDLNALDTAPVGSAWKITSSRASSPADGDHGLHLDLRLMQFGVDAPFIFDSSSWGPCSTIFPLSRITNRFVRHER